MPFTAGYSHNDFLIDQAFNGLDPFNRIGNWFIPLCMAKAGKSAGVLPVSPEIVSGVAIAPVAVGVWQFERRIHRAIAKE
ncbi:MAG: hypothetical protein R6V42_08435 [Orrella sp.]